MLHISTLPAEVLRLIFEGLGHHKESLLNAGLTCRPWRANVLPILLKSVDLSCHNEEELPYYCRSTMHPYFLEIGDETEHTREKQISFLRLVIGRPELALMVQSLAWTLMWRDPGDDNYTDEELHLWDVFSRMKNVKTLDLVSVHDNGHFQHARQNPDVLFPAVCDLRLGGWMHRGLAKAIITSISPRNLVALNLDHLQDEGAWLRGYPITCEVVEEATQRLSSDPPQVQGGISDELFSLQERGQAYYLPDPMWYALKLLLRHDLSALRHLIIKMCPPVEDLDKRNYVTMVQEIAKLIQGTHGTLKSISILLGECSQLYPPVRPKPMCCGPNIGRIQARNRMAYQLASICLRHIIPTLTDTDFPNLQHVSLTGFQILERYKEAAPILPDTPWDLVSRCPFVDWTFTEAQNVDYFVTFSGYDETNDDMYTEHKQGSEWAEAENFLFKSLHLA